MAYQKTQGREAHNVIKSDNANIPYTTKRISGSSGAVEVDKLVASGSSNFINSGVQIGDIVYNTTDNTAATVILVDSATKLTLNADIFTNASNYIIYAASPGEGDDANNGCVLYIGKSGDLSVNVVGGESPVIFKAVPIGFFPMQVTKINLKATTADDFVAIW